MSQCLYGVGFFLKGYDIDQMEWPESGIRYFTAGSFEQPDTKLKARATQS